MPLPSGAYAPPSLPGASRSAPLPIRLDAVVACEPLGGNTPGLRLASTHGGGGGTPLQTELRFSSEEEARLWLHGLQALLTAPRTTLPRADAAWLLTLFQGSAAHANLGLRNPDELNQLLQRLNLSPHVFRKTYRRQLPGRLTFDRCCEMHAHCVGVVVQLPPRWPASPLGVAPAVAVPPPPHTTEGPHLPLAHSPASQVRALRRRAAARWPLRARADPPPQGRQLALALGQQRLVGVRRRRRLVVVRRVARRAAARGEPRAEHRRRRRARAADG